MPRNVVQIVFDDGTVQVVSPVVVPPVVVSPPPPPPPPLGSSQIIRGGYFDGVPDNQAAAYAAPFGMTWVRVWFTIADWSRPLTSSAFARARALKAQGLKVLGVFTPPEKTGAPAITPDVAKTWFALTADAAGGAIDAWEVWNEPNLTNYNTSYAAASSLWVKNGLVPAYAALHDAGQFVVSGGWSGTAGDSFTWMVKNGLLQACDAVGYHPYGSGVADQLAKVQDMRNRIGPDKPLWITEWNLHMGTDTLGWAAALPLAAQVIKPYVQAVFHFRHVVNVSQAGVAAPYAADLSKRVPWYDATANAMGVL